jgi:hypothetical protein
LEENQKKVMEEVLEKVMAKMGHMCYNIVHVQLVQAGMPSTIAACCGSHSTVPKLEVHNATGLEE